MNIIDLQERLKDLPEQSLMQEMQMPTGTAPQFLVLSELKRRKRMRDEYQRQQAQGMQTVAEEAITAAGMPQQGIMGISQAMAPRSAIAQDTGVNDMMQAEATRAPQPQEMPVQGMYDGGYVRKMQVGGSPEDDYLIFLERRNLTDSPEARRMYAITAENNTAPRGISNVSADVSAFLPNASGAATIDFDASATEELADDSRSFGQRYVGDPLRSLFQPVGESMRETLQPVGESMRETLQPVGEDLTQVLRGRPQESYSFVPPRDPRLDPQPLSYDQIISRAQSGAMPSLDQLQSSVEAGLLTSQQAADVQAMTEGTGYLPSDQEISAANAPGMSTVIPDDPRLVTDPYLLGGARTEIGQTVEDYLAGAFGGRSVQEQLDINAARTKAIEENVLSGGDGAGTSTAETTAPRTRDQGLSYGLGSLDRGTIDVGPDGIPLSFGTAATDAATQPDLTTTTSAIPDGGGGGGGALGSIESRVASMIEEREKSAQADKWLALAQTGLALMASDQPTIGGAIGEAGLAGIGAMQQARSAYDKDILTLLDAQAGLQRSRASGGGRSRRQSPAELKSALDYLRGEVEDLATVTSVNDFGQEVTTKDYTRVPASMQADIKRLRDQYLAAVQGGIVDYNATQ
jgi:hypothetical protein